MKSYKVSNNISDNRDISIEPERKLWCAVLSDGIYGAMWKILRKSKGNNIYEYWDYDSRDRRWVMADNRYFNGFIELCDLLGLDSALIRKKIKLIPNGYFEGERLVENKR